MKITLEELGVIRFCGGCSSSEHQQRNYADQGRACCPDGDQKYVIAKEVESLLSEGKLVKPMSEDEIKDIYSTAFMKPAIDAAIQAHTEGIDPIINAKDIFESVVKAIYTAQFERTEK